MIGDGRIMVVEWSVCDVGRGSDIDEGDDDDDDDDGDDADTADDEDDEVQIKHTLACTYFNAISCGFQI